MNVHECYHNDQFTVIVSEFEVELVARGKEKKEKGYWRTERSLDTLCEQKVNSVNAFACQMDLNLVY